MQEKHEIVLLVSVNNRVIAERRFVVDNPDIALLCAGAMGIQAIEATRVIAKGVDAMRERYDAADPDAIADTDSDE